MPEILCVKVHDCLGSGAPWQKMCHYICEKPPYSTQIMLCQPLRFASVSSHIFLISNFGNKCVYMVMGLSQDVKKVFPLHCVCVCVGGGGLIFSALPFIFVIGEGNNKSILSPSSNDWTHSPSYISGSQFGW